jgi:hypothetical protein
MKVHNGFKIPWTKFFPMGFENQFGFMFERLTMEEILLIRQLIERYGE